MFDFWRQDFFRWLKPLPIFESKSKWMWFLCQLHTIWHSVKVEIVTCEQVINHCGLLECEELFATESAQESAVFLRCIGTSTFWQQSFAVFQVEPEVTPTSGPGWSRCKLSSWRLVLLSAVNMWIVVDHVMVAIFTYIYLHSIINGVSWPTLKVKSWKSLQCLLCWRLWPLAINTPCKINMEAKNHPWKERKMIFQTSMIMFHVNFERCTCKNICKDLSEMLLECAMFKEEELF